MAVDSQGNEIGKLFVGGLHQSTTKDSFKAYFSQFGDIEESVVMMDNRTGRSRGFGYIKFKENLSVDSVLAQKRHLIDHKEVDPQRCNVNRKGKNRRSLKVFVGGIAFEHDESVIWNFFSQYGRVTDVNLLISPNKQRHRGFAFVGFDDEEVVKNLIRLHYLNIDGKQVEVKAMEPPVNQRGAYPLSGGNAAIAALQTNGRAVRGGRNNHFAQLPPSDSYPPWGQWPAVGTSSWNPGPSPWATQQTVAWGDGSNGPPGDVTQPGLMPPAHLCNLVGHAPSINWREQPGSSANGWMPPGWGAQGAVPTTNNRFQLLNDEFSLYNSQQQQQQQRKSRQAWDSICFAALAPGLTTRPNEMINSPETWNPSTGSAGTFCQLAPFQLGPTLSPAPSTTDWNQVTGSSLVSDQHHQWAGSNNLSASLSRSCCLHQTNTCPGNPTHHGFLNDSSMSHPNGAAVAAMVAATTALGMSGSPGSHLASVPANGNPSNMKLDDATYQPPGGYGYSSAPGNSLGNMTAGGLHRASTNGLLCGDWCPTIGTQVPAFTHATSQQPLYRR